MTTTLKPTLALLVHSEPHSQRSGPVVLSLHNILSPDSHPVLDSGRLLGQEEAHEIAAAILNPTQRASSHQSGFLPPSLLRQTPGSLTWFRAPAEATLYWKGAKVSSTRAVLPGLIFHVRHRVLYVAAFEGSERPSEGTTLYHAPLSNVFADTCVCVGNSQLPATMAPSDMAEWERVLLGTNFSHVNHPHTIKGGATTEEHVAFWQRRKRAKSPPGRRFLAPLGVSAEQWLRKVEGAA